MDAANCRGRRNVHQDLNLSKENHAKYIKSIMESLNSSKMAVCVHCFPGKTVLIVNGIHRGSAASLASLDEKSFSVTVDLKDVSLARHVCLTGNVPAISVGLELLATEAYVGVFLDDIPPHEPPSQATSSPILKNLVTNVWIARHLSGNPFLCKF